MISEVIKNPIDVRIILAFLWVALMLTYLLGDVLRIFSGDFAEMSSTFKQFTKPMYLGIAALMVLPIIMIFLTLTLDHGVNRWVNLGMASFFFLFNLVGLPSYPSAYDKFLIVVGLIWNIITFWYAWKWV